MLAVFLVAPAEYEVEDRPDGVHHDNDHDPQDPVAHLVTGMGQDVNQSSDHQTNLNNGQGDDDR